MVTDDLGFPRNDAQKMASIFLFFPFFFSCRPNGVKNRETRGSNERKKKSPLFPREPCSTTLCSLLPLPCTVQQLSRVCLRKKGPQKEGGGEGERRKGGGDTMSAAGKRKKRRRKRERKKEEETQTGEEEDEEDEDDSFLCSFFSFPRSFSSAQAVWISANGYEKRKNFMFSETLFPLPSDKRRTSANLFSRPWVKPRSFLSLRPSLPLKCLVPPSFSSPSSSSSSSSPCFPAHHSQAAPIPSFLFWAVCTLSLSLSSALSSSFFSSLDQAKQSKEEEEDGAIFGRKVESPPRPPPRPPPRAPLFSLLASFWCIKLHFATRARDLKRRKKN